MPHSTKRRGWHEYNYLYNKFKKSGAYGVCPHVETVRAVGTGKIMCEKHNIEVKIRNGYCRNSACCWQQQNIS